MTQDKALKFSLNVDILDKYPKENLSEHNNKFKNYDGTLLHLKQAISFGIAFSYQFYNEERNSANFLCSDFLAIDIDGGWVISEALQNPIISKFCSLLYTTPSHTIDKHRFRLVFILPRTITDSKELKAATKALARRLGGDMLATDAARMFYGSSKSDPMVFNNEISDEFLNELIADGYIDSISDSIAGRPTMSKSKLTLKSNYQIKTADNSLLEFSEFKNKTTVFCPFHHDEHASAFVGLNSKAIPFLFCSTCQTTRWLEGAYSKNFDFNSFENLVNEHLNNPPIKKPEFVSPIAQLSSDVVKLESKNIHFSNDRYLRISKIENGLTFIKSPKGTGKTNFLKDYLQNIIYKFGSGSLEDFENNSDFEVEESMYTDKKVLLIGHRQALINEMCNRLGLISYLEVKNLRELKGRSNQNYGVCLDSLCSALGDQSNSKWDVVIIDESEQVLSHFLSETLGSKRTEIFNQLNNIICNAKNVIALDADLGWVTFNTITKMAKPHDNVVKPIQIYINKWFEDQKPIFLYQTSNQLINHLKESISQGKRVFVSSNSKNKILALEKSVQELGEKLNINIPMMTITSGNSKSPNVQSFIKNIKDEVIKYNVILSSPSLGTGIDITFANDAEEIDFVYGLYENRINTHFEVDQQLRRVRHPKEVHVWLSPSWFNFETEFEIVKEEYLNNNYLLSIYNQQSMGYESNEKSNIFLNNFLMMATLITVNQRASKNKLKRNFIDYKESEGWKVISVIEDEAEHNAGKLFLKTGKDLLIEENITAILDAKPIRMNEYDDISERMASNSTEITRKEYFSLLRTNLELFYRSKINREIIISDDFGKLRRGILAYETITNELMMNSIQLAKFTSSANENNQSIIESIFPNKNSKAILLFKLFEKTPIFKDGRFLSGKVYQGKDLTEFINLMITLKPFIENHLGLNIRKDIVNKPAQQLGLLLKEVGLGHRYTNKEVINGVKIYSYKLDEDKLVYVMRTLNRRNKKDDQWTFLNKLHKFENDKYYDVPDTFLGAGFKRTT